MKIGMAARCLGVFFVMWLVLGCTSEKNAATGARNAGSETSASGNAAVPSASEGGPCSLKITPEAPTRNSTLSVKTQGFQSGRAKIEWTVNGKPVSGPYADKFRATNLSRGDKVMAKATVDGKEVLSEAVEIGNTPPEIVKAQIVPERTGTGGHLRVEAEARDPDGDEVTLAYEWTKNGERAGDGEVLETALKRGDKVTVKVTPSDVWNQGGSVVIPLTIRNMPPVIGGKGKFYFDESECTYRVDASDPDGDPLKYSLKGAPSGMTVDSAGVIKWKVPSGFAGKVSFDVVVDDGQGGQATEDLKLTIGSEEP